MPLWKFVLPLVVTYVPGSNTPLPEYEIVDDGCGIRISSSLRGVSSSFKMKLSSQNRDRISCGLRLCAVNGAKDYGRVYLTTYKKEESPGVGLYLSAITDIQPLIGSVFIRTSCVVSGEDFL